jgi:succinoglycan biosynthesis protein ExoA
MVEHATSAVAVSVLVPVLDEERHLREAVADMLRQDLDEPVEFVFLDGGSRDRSRGILEQIASEDPRVRVLDNPARRTPQALNLGLAAARGTYVARMDAHTHYPVDYLSQGVARLRRGDVVSVSGPQLAVGDGSWSRRVALALSTPLGTGAARFRRPATEEQEVASGFTGLWRRDVLVAAGGWDEEWRNDQDSELAARLRKQGGRIVCLPAMAATYRPRDSLSALFAQYRRYGWYRVKTSHRHPETLRLSQLLPPALVLAVPLAAGGPRWSVRTARAVLAAYTAVLMGTATTRVRDVGVREAAALPPVYGVMHAAYGLGFLSACLRLGPPVRAVSALLRTSGSGGG